MSTRQGFIDAVTASPGDDALWSIFADWLDDHGEPARAELIRLECELERLAPAEDRALELRRRAEDLLVENERAWLGDWAEHLVRWHFRRGFLHDVTLQPETFCRDGATLLREHPVYRFAFVDDEGGCIAPEAVDEVVAAPHMAAVRALDLSAGKESAVYSHPAGSSANPTWAKALAKAGHVARLEELVFADSTGRENQRLQHKDLKLLAGAGQLRSLRSLDLGDEFENPNINAGAIAILAAGAFAGRLRSLRLAVCPIGDEGVARLASDEAFASLRALDLCGCGISARSVRAVLESPTLARLENVGMDFKADLFALAASPRLAGFRSLAVIGGNGDDEEEDEAKRDDAWTALARSPHFRPKSLWLEYLGLDQRDLDALFASEGLAGLQELRALSLPSLDWRAFPSAAAARSLATLDLDDVKVGQDRWLANWEGLARLRELHLTSCDSLAKGLPALLRSPYFGTNLTALSLVWCQLKEPDVIKLANCPALSRLRSLRLNWQSLSEKAMTALAASPHLQRLEKLHVAGSATDKVAASPLAHAECLPRLREVAISSLKKVTAPARLRRRFGPRLRLFQP